MNVTLNLVLILKEGMGVRAIFIANLAASACVLLFLLPQFARFVRFRFDPGLWRSLLAFGLPFVPSGIAYALSERVSLFFLARLSEEQVVALYGTAIDAGAIASISAGDDISVYGQYIVSVFGDVLQAGDRDDARVADVQVRMAAVFPQPSGRRGCPSVVCTRLYAVHGRPPGFVVLAVSFFAYELVSIPLPGGRHLIPPAYWLGLQIVPMALVGYVFQGWYYNFSVGIYLEKRTKYFIHATLVGGSVSLILTALLVPKPWG